MTTYNTGKAVGSSDPRDLYDNAENLDTLVNSPDKLEHADRLGVARKTWHGIEEAFQTFLLESGYQDIGTYAAGVEITARNQIFVRSGEYYRAAASLALPYTTTGDWATEGGNFVSVGDAALRQELATDGSTLVTVATSTGTQTLADALSGRIIYCNTVADMLALDSSLVPDGAVVITVQRKSFRESGGAAYKFHASSTATVNGGTVLQPNDSTTARYIKFVDQTISAHEFGLERGGAADIPANVQAIKNAIASLDTGNAYTGGIIDFNSGLHYLDSEITVDSSSVDNILGTTLSGVGMLATSLTFENATAGNGFVYTHPLYIRHQNMTVNKAPLSGVKLVGAQTLGGDESWNQVIFENVRASYNGLHGFEFEQGFMGHFKQLLAAGNASNGFEFKGLHTSLHLDNCYANENGNGYKLHRVTYSTLTACAADFSTFYGYNISKSSTLALNNCGAESTGRSAVALLSSTAEGANKNVMINGLLAFKNNTANAGYPNAIYMKAADGEENSAIAIGCRSHSPAYPVRDVIVDGEGSYLIEGFNDFPSGVLSSNNGYIHHLPKTKVVRALSVTAATTVTALQSTQGHTVHYGGEITIKAANNDPSSQAATNTATYKLLVDKGAGGANVAEIAKVGLTAGGAASHPSFTWSMSGNNLVATPVASTSGTFTFEILTSGFVKTA